MNYYNEFDPRAAAWLRQLIKDRLIPKGVVDERSIKEVRSGDLRGFQQCHFFAGIGGWSEALRLANWPKNRQVWTGSCPCQPYSVSGKGQGEEDDRNLWPEFYRLIRKCRPQCVFGEQVAAAIGFSWLDGVSADLDKENYACGAVVLGAHSTNAPHIRQRLFWVGDPEHNGSHQIGKSQEPKEERRMREPKGSSVRGVANTDGGKSSNRNSQRSGQHRQQSEDTDTRRKGVAQGNTYCERFQGRGGGPSRIRDAKEWQEEERYTLTADFWGDYELVRCRDGKARRIEPGTFPLAHGIPSRVGLLRGYGNAIVPQVAAVFIQAYLEIEKEWQLPEVKKTVPNWW